VYELLGKSSGVGGFVVVEVQVVIVLLVGFGSVALGDIYGDCNAETNADEGGETRGDS
jgi:hypothetical protein